MENTMEHLRSLLILAVVAAAAVSVSLPTHAQSAPTYEAVGEVAIGGEGGWDYLALDEGASRLYVSHATSYAVVDTNKRSVVGTIADTPGAHGFAIAPGLDRGFTTNGRENMVSVVQLSTLKTLSKVSVGEGPDAILYAAQSKRVYVFCGDGKSASVIDPRSAKVVATVALGGAPEFAVEDPAAGRIYNNLEDTNEVVAIDEKTNKVVERWSLAPATTPTGLAIDTAHHRLFSGCRSGAVVALDSTTGKIVSTWKIGMGVDACRFDPALRLVFASCADGTVTIARENDPSSYTVVQTLATGPGARTMTLDPKTHRIYLSTAQLKPAPEPAEGQPRARPSVVPGTFKVLVFGPK